MTKEKITNITKLIIMLILFFLLADCFKFIFSVFNIDISRFNYSDLVFLDALIEVLLALAIYILYRKELTKDLNIFKETNDKLSKCFKLFCIFMLVKIIAGSVGVLLGLLMGIDSGTSENQALVDLFTKSSPFLMIISSVIFAPIVEEGIFRLGLRKIFKNKYLFIVISGLLFGLMHIFPTDLGLTKALIDSISYIAMGITLAYIYAEKNNIWYTILIHMANNLLGMVAILFIT